MSTSHSTSLTQEVIQGTLMKGKKGLIMGVANDRSIAWAIASAVAAQGGQLAFTYQGEALGKRVVPLAQSIGSHIVVPCDVSEDEDIDKVFSVLEKEWGELDFVVHAIGWADKQYLRGRYVDIPRDSFLSALDISCYSFVAVAQRAAKLLKRGGSLLTLSYLGAERVMPHYNVMGVAKAALEASVRYIAADLGRNGIRAPACPPTGMKPSETTPKAEPSPWISSRPWRNCGMKTWNTTSTSSAGSTPLPKALITARPLKRSTKGSMTT